MKFQCGCTTDGASRCATHEAWDCHDPLSSTTYADGECPLCWTARLRSVSLSSDATPTRGKR